ncbi:MAG TPA: Yip1 family protein [Gemmatimonadaceae bacterium]|nr:Yip1 family protein [Gemmatimonadaceae bacterium]
MTATAAPKTPSVWEDFIDIFTSPSQVFERRQNANFFLPMIVVTLIIALIYLGTKSLTQPVFDAEFARGMAAAMRKNPQITPDQMAKGKDIAEKFSIVFVLFGIPIAMFFVGLLLWFVGKLFDSKMTFAGGVLVAAYAAFPKIFAAIAGPVIAYFSDPSTLTSASKITVSAAHFFDVSNTSPVVLALLSRIDVFTIWSTILLGIGLSVLGKIPRSRAYIAAVIVWVLATVFPIYQAMRTM